MKSIVLQKYSNRELRFGWQDFPASRPKPDDTASISANDAMSALVHESLLQSAALPNGGLVTFTQSYRDPKFYDAIERPDQEKRLKRALDITSEFRRANLERRKNKRQPGTPYNKTVFTRAARHTLLEAGATADRWAGCPGNSAVVTLTLPGSTEAAYSALAAWSGYVCDRLFRKLRKHGDSLRWFYVWEWQKRGALHLHILVSGRVPEQALEVARELPAQWFRVLDDVRLKSGVDLFLHKTGNRCTVRSFWQADVQRVERSISAYFSKYASKPQGKESPKGFSAKGLSHPYPGRWWGCQRLLRQEVESNRWLLRVEGIPEEQVVEILTLIDNWANSHCPCKRYRYDFEVTKGVKHNGNPLGYGERHVLYYEDEFFANLSCDFLSLVDIIRCWLDFGYWHFNRPELSGVGTEKGSALTGLTSPFPYPSRRGVESRVIPA